MGKVMKMHKVWVYLLIISATNILGCSGGGTDVKDPPPNNIPETYTIEQIGEKLTGDLHLATVSFGARNDVRMEVYLPPSWSAQYAPGYPVVYFLHGRPGHELVYFNQVEYQVFNDWINSEQLPPFVVIALDSGHSGPTDSWITSSNEGLLTDETNDSLRAFVQDEYNAGHSPDTTSITGNSIGAEGSLYYAFNHPQLFSAAVANAFVSTNTVTNLADNAERHLLDITVSEIKIRVAIGDQDSFVTNNNNRAALNIHNEMNILGIVHEYEVLIGGGHALRSTWNITSTSGSINGLHEYMLFANEWERRSNL